MGHIFTNNTLPATGNGLLQLTVFIAQHDCQAIQLPGNQYGPMIGKGDHLVDRLGLCGGEHRLGMPHGCQFLQDLTGYLLGGRSGNDDTGCRFQFQQLIRQQIVLEVSHDRLVIPVVGNIRLFQDLDQFLHTKDVGFIHTHSCVPPFL